MPLPVGACSNAADAILHATGAVDDAPADTLYDAARATTTDGHADAPMSEDAL